MKHAWPHGSKVSAIFSDDRVYRYHLECVWSNEAPVWTFVMLNPSTADEEFSDPTVSRCISRAAEGGAGAAIITNLFALRATNPKEMLAHPHPIEDEHGKNDWHILNAAEHSAKTIVAWGTHGAFRLPCRASTREQEVMWLLRVSNITPFRIGTPTQQGHPRHPLYLRKSDQLEPHPS